MHDLLNLATIKKIIAAINFQKALPTVEGEAKVTLSSALNREDGCGNSFELSPIQQFYLESELSKENGL